MTHSKIKDVWSDGTIYLEDGSHFGADLDTEGPFVTFGSGRVYLAVGQLIGHAPLGELDKEASSPSADSQGDDGSALMSVALAGGTESIPGIPPDEGNHPSVQTRVSP